MTDIMTRLNEHYNYLKNKGYDICCLMLQGSQNYGLDEYTESYQSDVDSKAIVIPSFRDFVYDTPPVSKTEVLPNGEHIDVKDIRIMFEMFKKSNISYIELLFTSYKIINPKYYKDISLIFKNRQDIAEINYNQFLKCIGGMARNKAKVLCHPYPTVIDKIEKYGYDGKQLSHLVRLYEFINRYVHGTPIEECYWTEDREMLMNFKKQLTPNGDRVLRSDEAITAAFFYLDAIETIVDWYLLPHCESNQKTIEMLDSIKYRILEQKFREDLNYARDQIETILLMD